MSDTSESERSPEVEVENKEKETDSSSSDEEEGTSSSDTDSGGEGEEVDREQIAEDKEEEETKKKVELAKDKEDKDEDHAAAGARLQEFVSQLTEEEYGILRRIIRNDELNATAPQNITREPGSKDDLGWMSITLSEMSVTNKKVNKEEGKENVEEKEEVNFLEEEAGGQFLFNDITCTVRDNSGFLGKIPFFPRPKKLLLDGISGSFKGGNLVAVMGPSGSGKTTLLHTLAGRFGKTKVSGKVLINGTKLKTTNLRKWAQTHVGFVPQEDHLWDFLTVKETLYFAALLYLSSSAHSIKEKLQRARDVMKFIMLDDVADVKVGNSMNKGISGGQKRRLSAGIEIINAPSVMLLDEPTSGLDALSAAMIIHVLRKIADSGRLVVVTIHQPRHEIFAQFDELVLLKTGKMVYSGPPSQARHYFASLGHKLPVDANPSDYLLDILADNEFPDYSEVLRKQNKEKKRRAAEKTSLHLLSFEKLKDFTREPAIPANVVGSMIMRTTQTLKQRQKEEEEEEEEEEGQSTTAVFYKKSNLNIFDYLFSFIWLTAREVMGLWRSPVFVWVPIAVSILLGALLASIFADIGTNVGVTCCQALIIALFIQQGICNPTAYRLAAHHPYIRWEIAQGMYHELPFYLCRQFVESFMYLICSFFFSTVWYWIVDFQHNAGNYFYFLMMCMLVTSFSATLIRALGYIAPSGPLINILYTLMAMAFAIVNGWLVPYPNIPPYWIWLYWINPYSYFIMAVLPRELQETADGRLLYTLLEFPIEEKYYIYPLVIICDFFLALLLGYLALRFLNKRVT